MESSTESDAAARASTGTYMMDRRNPLYIHPSDNPGASLVLQFFDGKGFNSWRRAMLIALSAKNKIGFLDGTFVRPDHSSPDFMSWEICNYTVISWLLSALDNRIADSVMYIESTKGIWDELNSRYGTTDGTEAYNLEKEICSISQGTDNVMEYFTRLRKIWDEMSALFNLPPCNCIRGLALDEREQQRKLFQFLMGLNDSFSIVREECLQLMALLQKNQEANSKLTTNSYSNMAGLFCEDANPAW